MAVPKRRHSKGRTRRKRNEKLTKTVVVAHKIENKKTYKRPHVEEAVELD